MKDLLKSAISALSITNIFIRQSNISLSDGCNSFNFNDFKKKNQSFRTVKRIEAIELVDETEKANNRLFYSFHYSVGTRFIDNSEDTSDDPLFIIEADFEAIYLSKKELSKEELEEFAKQNVGFNVWPFWREYVQSTCSRMGITSVKVPFYKFNKSDVPDLEDK